MTKLSKQEQELLTTYRKLPHGFQESVQSFIRLLIATLPATEGN
jgi:hypothetical protein